MVMVVVVMVEVVVVVVVVAVVVVVVAVVVVRLEHGGHAAQSGQLHFVAHGLDLRAHQLSQSASHFGSALVDPAVLVNLPGGHFFWAMH